MGAGREGKRGSFHAISAYVHSTHLILALGAVIAPAVALALQPQPVLAAGAGMLVAVFVSAGASALVTAEFVPYHPRTRWLRDRHVRGWVRAGVLVAAFGTFVLTPVAGLSITAAAVSLAWALRAVAGGLFWSGLVRLLGSALAIGFAAFATDVGSGRPWEPLTLIVAALLALGVLGQDAIYTLAIELDDLRSREAEHAVITERKRFAGDLHDIQGQHLGLITVEAELVLRFIDRVDYSAAVQHVERIQSITTEALEEMHRLVHANREVCLDEEIANAVRVLRSAGIAVERDTIEVLDLDGDADRLLGLTVREGITNILKHSQARTCSITTRQRERRGYEGVELTVADSGPRSSSAPTSFSGTGLKMLDDRYRRRDGALHFAWDDGGLLTGWLPVANRIVKGDIA